MKVASSVFGETKGTCVIRRERTTLLVTTLLVISLLVISLLVTDLFHNFALEKRRLYIWQQKTLSSYVQHLAWVVWYKSGETVTDKDITDAINDLLEQNKVFFQREVELLSEHQLNFLRALSNGVTTRFTRKEVIRKYRLESSANVLSVKKALLKKDLIDVDGPEISFNDSLFKLWLKRQRFYE